VPVPVFRSVGDGPLAMMSIPGDLRPEPGICIPAPDNPGGTAAEKTLPREVGPAPLALIDPKRRVAQQRPIDHQVSHSATGGFLPGKEHSLAQGVSCKLEVKHVSGKASVFVIVR